MEQRSDQDEKLTLLKQVSPYIESIALVVLLAMVQMRANSLLEDRARFTLLMIAPCYGTWRAGLGPGLLAVVCSACIGAFLFAVPQYSFAIQKPGDVVSLILFVVVSITVVLFGEAHRVGEMRVKQREKELKKALEELAVANAQLEAMVERRTEELIEIRRWAAEEL